MQVELAAHALLGGGIIGCDHIGIVGDFELRAGLSRVVVVHGRQSVVEAQRVVVFTGARCE